MMEVKIGTKTNEGNWYYVQMIFETEDNFINYLRKLMSNNYAKITIERR